MGLKYITSIGVNKFEFKDGITSISIAELMVNNFVPSDYNKELTVLIEVSRDNEKAEEDTGNDEQ